MGRALVLRAAAAALAPLLLVALLAWPRSSSTASIEVRAPQSTAEGPATIDTSAVRAAALALVDAAATPPRDGPRVEASADLEGVQALGLLTERIYAARDARRAAGKTGAELRKPFSLEELGGDVLTRELGLAPLKRLVVLRTGAVLGPDGASLAAATFSGDARAHAAQTTFTRDGVTWRAVRLCPYGELTCLVDVSAASPVGAGATAGLSRGTPDTRALDDALAALARGANATSSTGAAGDARASTASGVPASTVPFGVAWALALVVACAAIAWVAIFAERLAGAVVKSTGRLLQAAAGRAPDPAPPQSVRELAALHEAVTAAARGVSEAATRLEADGRRRERTNAVAEALARAAAERNLAARVQVEDLDDAGLLALVGGANRLLEALDQAVLRLQSHADAVAPRAANARALEERAQRLRPLASLLGEASARVLRVALIDGVPQRAQDELRSLGEALGQRAKAAQAGFDALLLDLATEAPQDRHASALQLLQGDLAAFKTSQTAPERVAALRDLAPAEIGERVAGERV